MNGFKQKQMLWEYSSPVDANLKQEFEAMILGDNELSHMLTEIVNHEYNSFNPQK